MLRTTKAIDATKLALARSLFRADKWDPARDGTQPFAWESQRAAYITKADRLLRTFEKDGLKLSVTDSAATGDA